MAASNVKTDPANTGSENMTCLERDEFGLNPENMSVIERRSAISGYDLKHRIEAIVAGITTKKINHVYRGDGAATAPGLMILPRIVATSLFPMRHVRVILGYTAHEISHQLKTNFKILERLISDKSIPDKKKRHIKEFWNAIEDYRIEKLVKSEYPGFHVLIDDTRDFTARRFCQRVDKGLFTGDDLANPYRIGAVALTWVGAKLNGYKTSAPEDALNRLDPPLKAWVYKWEQEMSQVNTNKEAYELALKIVEELEEMAEEEEESEENSQGQGSSDENDDTDNSGGQNSQSDSSEEDGDESSEDNNGKTSSEDNSQGKESETGQESDGDGEDSKTSNKQKMSVQKGDEEANPEAADLEIDDLKDAINKQEGPEAQDIKVVDEGELSGKNEDGTPNVEIIKQGQAAYNQIRQNVSSASARSAGILRRLLQSTNRKTWVSGKEEGDLDFGRIVGMTRGDQDIYRQKDIRTSVNTAVSLLLDNSGSMSGNPLRICQETSVVLDMAIQGTKTNLEINGFTSNSKNRPVLYRYRAFGQKGQAASASLGNMTEVQLGGTPVSTPLLEAWRRLSVQKEPRRIMIIVSDGGADYHDVRASKIAHDFIRQQGCIIFGVAIGCEDQMKQWCDNVHAIQSMTDLPIALTNLIKESIK